MGVGNHIQMSILRPLDGHRSDLEQKVVPTYRVAPSEALRGTI